MLLPQVASSHVDLLQGADFIECDIALTNDCNLVCRHEPLLSGTTNADELFPERITSYDIDNKPWQVRLVLLLLLLG